MPEKVISFGRGFVWDSGKTPEENWEVLKANQYKKNGVDIGDMPPLNNDNFIKTMMPDIDKMIDEVKRQNITRYEIPLC